MNLNFKEFFLSPQLMWPMRICRMVFGGSLFLHYLSTLPQWSATYGPDAVSGIRYHLHVPDAQSFGRITSNTFHFLNFVDSTAFFYVSFALLLLSSFAFAIGYKTRVSGSIALILHTLFHSHNEYSFWGWGDLIKPFMLYVILSRSDKLEGPGWPIRLLQIHISVMYLQTAWVRLDDPNWLNGSMLQGILTDSIFSRFDSDFMSLQKLLIGAGTSAWILELVAPIALWIPRTRLPVVILLIAMHIGLELTTMVGYWNFMMVAALLVFKTPLPQFYIRRRNRYQPHIAGAKTHIS